jgi:hypothetical protein
LIHVTISPPPPMYRAMRSQSLMVLPMLDGGAGYPWTVIRC